VDDERHDDRLPRAESAIVEPAKLSEYLLDGDHPVGGDKAAFLSRFGFRRGDWRILESVLLGHARDGRVIGQRQTVYGPTTQLRVICSRPMAGTRSSGRRG
jgi:hypothetical protein